MLLSANIEIFHQELGIKKTIDVLSEAGFESIDFNTDIKEYYDDTHGKDFYLDLKKYAQDRNMIFRQAHAPFWSSFADETRTEQRFFEIVQGMKHASYLGSEMIVVHPYKHIKYTKEREKTLFDMNVRFYKRLLPYARDLGIKIAIENINDAGDKEHTITSTAERLARLYDELNDPTFTICFDVGHGAIVGEDAARMIRYLSKRIGCTHIHDNDGLVDSHTLPYYGGKIDWESVISAFAEIGYEQDISYEANNFVVNVPNELKADAAKYMASVGKYIINRIKTLQKSRKVST